MSSPEGQAGLLTVRAAAKINLFLHVRGKRPDGYHELESLVAFSEVGDHLELALADSLTLEISGPFASALTANPDNLVLKAAIALRDSAALPSQMGAAIRLAKYLPVASGIGGGSADAAATLRGLNALWKLQRTETELCALGAEIGSDVPACVLSRPLWMTGRGETLNLVADGMPPAAMVLVNPGVALPTGKVFGSITSFESRKVLETLPPHFTLGDLVAFLRKTGNDLTKSACEFEPIIAETIKALEARDGCMFAQMSGSGATCFGLFEDEEVSMAAEKALTEKHPEWWVRATRIAQPEIILPIA